MEEIFKGEDLSGLTESRRRPQWAIEEAAGFICSEDSRFELEADKGRRGTPRTEREWTLESFDLSSEEDYQMKIKDEVTEEIKTKTKNALGETTMFFGFEGLDERLPQTRGKTPTQSESEQSYKFRKTFRVLKMSRLQTKATGFKAETVKHFV